MSADQTDETEAPAPPREPTPHELIAAELPPMDPAERDRIIDLAKSAVLKVMLQRLQKSEADRRAELKRERKKNARAFAIRTAELRLERGLLALMEKEVRKGLGPKPWDERRLARALGRYRRLRRGARAGGLPPEPKPKPPDPLEV
ncbi:MAG: hypothetical protein R3D57_09820 [Hyphomicrobiaceae bacterium]